MLFFLQNDTSDLKYEQMIVSDLIKESHFHTQTEVSLKDISDKRLDNDMLRNIVIPVGSIEFVEKWAKQFWNIDHINPMEVPECLRIENFLKREYHIVPYDELPEEGRWFFKDVSSLKAGSFVGYKHDIPEFFNTTHYNEHFYQYSEVIDDILSEFRVYFINGEIENVCNYDGLPYVHPDFVTIDLANKIFSRQEDYPGSYTMDIMVTNRGTSIIECHPFVCVGLYSTLWGQNLLSAYADGTLYVKKHNTACYTKENSLC